MSKKWVLPAVLIAFLTTGCQASDDDSADAGRFQQALAYAECMRANGMPDYPDPELQDGGVRVKVPRGTPELEKAKEACRDKEPQGEAEDDGGATVDAAELTAWTNCMRARLPKFPDPEVSGQTVTVALDGTGLRGDSADFENARKECDSQSPGNVRVAD